VALREANPMNGEALVWLVFGGLPLFVVLYLVFCVMTGRKTPGDRKTVGAPPSALQINQWRSHVLLLPVAVGFYIFLLWPAPAQKDLRVIEGRVAALKWHKPKRGKFGDDVFSLTVEWEDSRNGTKSQKSAPRKESWGVPTELIARLEADSQALIGQRASVGVYPGSRHIFTLQIGDETYRSYEQGLKAHWWWRFNGFAIAFVLFLIWAAAQIHFRQRLQIEERSDEPVPGPVRSGSFLAGGVARRRQSLG
jgi:hypothetical protein